MNIIKNYMGEEVINHGIDRINHLIIMFQDTYQAYEA